jgi:acrylyl-CoA reductase (NADPH)
MTVPLSNVRAPGTIRCNDRQGIEIGGVASHGCRGTCDKAVPGRIDVTQRFRAVVAEQENTSAVIRELTLIDLPDQDVLVRISHSTLNYKDALAVTGRGKICRFFPMVCGIDLAGTVVESRDGSLEPGAEVIVNGFGLSERHWGGYGAFARIAADWAIRLPPSLSAEEAMAIGTAGYTAMLCVQALEDHGVRPNSGPVMVTGASGGVGSVAIMLLARLGYEVVAATGRIDSSGEFLRRLGASALIHRQELAQPTKPLASERWAGAVDCVGGDTLAAVLAQMRYGGTVTACGLAGGAALKTTVMPLILRGVTLAGVDSVMASRERRQIAWRRLEELVDRNLLRSIYEVQPMSSVPALSEQLLAGEVRGRIVVDVSR